MTKDIKAALSLATLLSIILVVGHPVSAQNPEIATLSANAFASLARREVSQLRVGVTLAQWMATQGRVAKWARSPLMQVYLTDPFHAECLSLLKNERLPSGAQVAIEVSFFLLICRRPGLPDGARSRADSHLLSRHHPHRGRNCEFPDRPDVG